MPDGESSGKVPLHVKGGASNYAEPVLPDEGESSGKVPPQVIDDHEYMLT